MTSEEEQRQQFALWLNSQLHQRSWTQGKLILHSGASDEGRLSSAAVSRYCTGKMLPDAASCQKIARALELPVELILRKAALIDPLPRDANWIQRAIADLAYAVDAGQLSEEGRQAIVAHIQREQRLQVLERQGTYATETQDSDMPDWARNQTDT